MQGDLGQHDDGEHARLGSRVGGNEADNQGEDLQHKSMPAPLIYKTSSGRSRSGMAFSECKR